MDLLTYLKLDTKAFEASVSQARTTLGGLGGAASGLAGAAGGTANALDSTADAATDVAAAAGDAEQALTNMGTAAGVAGGKVSVAGTEVKKGGAVMSQATVQANQAGSALQGVSAAAGMLSGSVSGAASGMAGLISSFKGLGAASALTMGLLVALVISLAMLGKAMLDLNKLAKQFNEDAKLGNAQAGVDSLRRAYERLAETMGGAVALMRDLRALSQQGDDIEFDKSLAQLDLDRKRELASLDPADEKGAARVNEQYDRKRTGMELDREAAGNTAGADEMRRQREENAATIAARREEMNDRLNEASKATRKAGQAEQRANDLQKPGGTLFGQGVQGKWSEEERTRQGEQAEKYRGVAGAHLDEAERIRSEVEELERKNQVLEEQARLYEKRNEVVEIKRAAADIPDKKEAGGLGGLSVSADRLTRIGGYMTPANSSSRKLETLGEKQLSEARLTRVAIERMSSGTIATWGA